MTGFRVCVWWSINVWQSMLIIVTLCPSDTLESIQQIVLRMLLLLHSQLHPFCFFCFTTGGAPNSPGSCSHLSDASKSDDDTTVSVWRGLVPDPLRPFLCFDEGELVPGGPGGWISGSPSRWLLFAEMDAELAKESSFSSCAGTSSSPADIALSRHSNIWSHRMLLFNWMYGATCVRTCVCV